MNRNRLARALRSFCLSFLHGLTLGDVRADLRELHDELELVKDNPHVASTYNRGTVAEAQDHIEFAIALLEGITYD